MRTKMKSLLVTLLAGVMVLGALVMNTGAEESSAARQKWLDQINSIRKEAYDEKLVDRYVPIQWSNDMEQIAALRSSEATANGFGPTIHNRPDGAGFWTALSDSGQNSQSEIIATTPDYGMSINLWYSEKGEFLKKHGGAGNYGETGHYEALIDPNLQYIGLYAVNGGFTVGELTSLAGVIPDLTPAPATQAEAPAAAPAPTPAPEATVVPAPAQTEASTPAPAAPAPVSPTATAPEAQAPAAEIRILGGLTPVSISLVRAMKALADMTREIPEMTPVVANVNDAIAQVIPVVEEAAAEDPEWLAAMEVPQIEVPAPEQVIDPQVSQYIAQAEAWIDTTCRLLEE